MPGDLVTISVGHHHVEEGVTPRLVVGQAQVPEGLVAGITDDLGLRDCLHDEVRTPTVLMTSLSLHSPGAFVINPNKLSKLQIIRCKLSIARRKHQQSGPNLFFG